MAARIGRVGVEQYLAPDVPLPCGIPGEGETPNLMLGLAGIGYFYLSLYGPSVRSVLLIEPRHGGSRPVRAPYHAPEEEAAAV